MGPVRVTCGRTLSRARSVFSTSLIAGCFLSAVAVLFSLRLEAAEGSLQTVVEIWALCAAQALPFLVSLLGMDSWCEERRSGRMDVLLATAVRERDLVLGKFLGLWILSQAIVWLSCGFTAAFLLVFAPSALRGVSVLGTLPALSGLLVQGGVWSAVAVAASAVFANASAAACVSVILTFALPRAVWAGLMAWSDAGRTSFGLPFVDAQILETAGGIVSVGAVATCLVCALLALFVASKGVVWARLVGRGAAGLRTSTVVAVLLAVLSAVLAVSLSSKVEVVLDIPVPGAVTRLSPRTRGILQESTGNVTLTCLLSRKDVRFRVVSRLMTLLKRESESVGGARFTLQYVDPHWDIGAAERLFARGIQEDALVFEHGRRISVLPLKEGVDERQCAAAVSRLFTAPFRRNIYWTVGHGEVRFDEYGAFGMSDIARDLARDGYVNRTIDLATAVQIPGDCALIVVAGARESFSREELGRLEAYLKEGGRLFVLLGRQADEGVASILPAWGIRPTASELSGLSTISGSNVNVSDFAEHPISHSLKGSRIVLESPTAFVPSAAADMTSGADQIDYTSIAEAGRKTFAVLAERGSGAGKDLAIRPTRIVAIGDASFALNGALASRANANRDFFLNCAAYLSGTEVMGAPGDGTGRLVSRLDRQGRFRHVLWSAVVFPVLVFLLGSCEVVRRRRRS